LSGWERFVISSITFGILRRKRGVVGERKEWDRPALNQRGETEEGEWGKRGRRADQLRAGLAKARKKASPAHEGICKKNSSNHRGFSFQPLECRRSSPAKAAREEQGGRAGEDRTGREGQKTGPGRKLQRSQSDTLIRERDWRGEKSDSTERTSP